MTDPRCTRCRGTGTLVTGWDEPQEPCPDCSPPPALLEDLVDRIATIIDPAAFDRFTLCWPPKAMRRPKARAQARRIIETVIDTVGKRPSTAEGHARLPTAYSPLPRSEGAPPT